MPASPAGFAAGGGFDVEPAVLRAGASPLAEAASAARDHGHSVAVEASTAACAAGVGPLAGELGGFGAEAEGAAGGLAGSLTAAGSALAASAEAYAVSDRPLAAS